MTSASFSIACRNVRHPRSLIRAPRAALFNAAAMRRAGSRPAPAAWSAEALEGRMLLSSIAAPLALGVTPAVTATTAFEVQLSLANPVIIEGDSASLAGSFTDPNAPTSAHTVQIQWGDGSTDMRTLPAGVSAFTEMHQYLDNRPADAPYLINAVVSDTTSTGTGQASEDVVNQLPSHVLMHLSKLTITSGQTESLTGSFRDPGTLDSHVVTINWGDQQSSTLDLAPGVLTFQASHLYSNGLRAPVTAPVEVSVLDSDSLPTFSGTPTVTNFQFSQLDWVNRSGVTFAANSSWGVMNVDVSADPTQFSFLNVVADAGSGPAWIVQNLPLDGNYNHQSVDFNIADLGLNAGTNLASLSYTFSIDSAIRSTEPTGTMATATVGDQTERPENFPGKTQAPPPPPGAPDGVKIQGTIDEKNSTAARPDVPGVQEGSLQCMPGAFARSVAWLNVAHALGLTKKDHGKNVPLTAQDIYKSLAKQLGRMSDGDRIELKADILAAEAKKAGKKGVTKVFDPGNSVTLPSDSVAQRDKSEKDLLKWMRREMNNGEDVEMTYAVKGDLWHIITVVRIIQTDKGTFLEYRDDEAQGNDKAGDAGIKTGELVSDGKGGYTFRRTEKGAAGGPAKPILFQVKYAVSESVIDAQVTVKPKGK
jgi:hypothetical protein